MASNYLFYNNTLCKLTCYFADSRFNVIKTDKFIDHCFHNASGQEAPLVISIFTGSLCRKIVACQYFLLCYENYNAGYLFAESIFSSLLIK